MADKMKIPSTFFLSLLFLFASCEKLEVPKGTPICIKQEIRKAESGEHSCINVVYRYDYKGETVYLFSAENSNCRDATASLYDDDCYLICTFGGISGNGDGRCPDFDHQATNKELIWRK